MNAVSKGTYVLKTVPTHSVATTAPAMRAMKAVVLSAMVRIPHYNNIVICSSRIIILCVMKKIKLHSGLNPFIINFVYIMYNDT